LLAATEDYFLKETTEANKYDTSVLRIRASVDGRGPGRRGRGVAGGGNGDDVKDEGRKMKDEGQGEMLWPF